MSAVLAHFPTFWDAVYHKVCSVFCFGVVAGKVAVVCGYGDVGKGSAASLKAAGARVLGTYLPHSEQQILFVV